jgi:hypothetical protein
MEMVGVEPTLPRCKRGALPPELHPRVKRGGRPDSNRNLEDHDLGCCRYTTTTTKSGDDRTRTGGLSPDKRLLLPLSYVPWMK